MRALTIIVADTSPDRFRAALSIASAHAALGGEARLFLQGRAVTLAHAPIAADDEDYVAGGHGTLASLFDTALDVGVKLILCQSGMQMAGMTTSTCDPRIEQGGLVSIMQTLGEGRLLAI